MKSVTTFRKFFAEIPIATALPFLLLYRFAEAQVVKFIGKFLLDSREMGGLGLLEDQIGLINGTLGVVVLLAGGVLGGMLAARDGLRKWLLPMAVMMNMTERCVSGLAYFQPTELGLDQRRGRHRKVRLWFGIHRLHVVHAVSRAGQTSNIVLRDVHRLHVAGPDRAGELCWLPAAMVRIHRLLHVDSDRDDSQLSRHVDRVSARWTRVSVGERRRHERRQSSQLPSPDDLSLREKIAQLVFVRIGSNMPPVRTVEQDEERVARLLEECPVGGLLLFNGGPETKAVARAAAGGVDGSAVGGVGHRARRGAASAGLHAVSACDGVWHEANAGRLRLIYARSLAREASRRRDPYHVWSRGRCEYESAKSDHSIRGHSAKTRTRGRVDAGST